MASVPIYSEDTSMALFRQAMPFGPGSGAIADRLCAIGRYRSLSSGEELPDDVMEDRLVFIAHGEAKLLAFAHPFGQGHIGSAKPDDPARHVLAFHFAGDIVSVLRQANAGFCLTALSDLDLVEFSARKFLDIAQDDPAILRSSILCKRSSRHARG